MDTELLTTDDPALAEVGQLNQEMEALAVEGEWEKISALLDRRNRLLRQLGPEAKREAFEASRRSTERIRRLAEVAQREVADKLSRLQRGREATDSYQAHA